MEFDEHGKVVKKKTTGNDLGLQDTIVVERSEDRRAAALFGLEPGPSLPKRKRER